MPIICVYNDHTDAFRYTTADKFYLEPTFNPTETLVIDRITGEATVKGKNVYDYPIRQHQPSDIHC